MNDSDGSGNAANSKKRAKTNQPALSFCFEKLMRLQVEACGLGYGSACHFERLSKRCLSWLEQGSCTFKLRLANAQVFRSSFFMLLD
jgi:hypothetical protein